jgi:site-specific DNA recombinase
MLVSGPRLFTSDSVKVILHNAFYAGLSKHKGELFPGAHEPLVTQETFDLVQTNLRKNSGRSRTLQKSPERE